MIPENSNWLLKNKILIGGLPRDKKAFDQIKETGITVFINLMRNTEYQSVKKKPSFDYRDKKNQKGAEYYNYQITDMKTLSDKKMIDIAEKALGFLKEGKKVYIHCLGGHGRTGVVAGLILHLKYPDMKYKQVIEKLHELHQKRKYAPNTKTPQMSGQFNQLHRIITGKDDIMFYNDTDKNYIFSNLYYRPKKGGKPTILFTVGGKSWYSSEAYFQAHKYVSTHKYTQEYFDLISKTDTGGKSFNLGRMKPSAYPMKVDGININTLIKKYKNLAILRPDWIDKRDTVMIIAILAKFAQNEDLFKFLMATGDKKIVEYSPKGDVYWGRFWDNKGKNTLGKMLMKLRECMKPHEKIFLKQFK